MISMVVVVALIGGIYKVFQIATAMNEVKDLLTDIKRNTMDYSHISLATSRPDESPRRPLGTALDSSPIRSSVLEPER